MNPDEPNAHFTFICELEPATLCSNFRYDSRPFWTEKAPIRVASFSVWQNMLAVFYHTVKDEQSFDSINAEAHYLATAIIACYGFLKKTALEYSSKNWVEFQADATKTKIIVGRFEEGIEPPVSHPDNDVFKQIEALMPLILSNRTLARSLHDFYSCLLNMNPDFYFYAYRAVEDIRSYFGAAENDKEKVLAWNSMNKALNHEEKDYKELVNLARESRHANKLGEVIDPEIVERQIVFVQSLIDGFIQYLSKRTEKPP